MGAKAVKKEEISVEFRLFLLQIRGLYLKKEFNEKRLGCYWIVDPDKQSEVIRQRAIFLRYLKTLSYRKQQASLISDAFDQVFRQNSPKIHQDISEELLDTSNNNIILWLTIDQILSQNNFNLEAAWNLRLLICNLMKLIQKGSAPISFDQKFQKVTVLKQNQLQQFSKKIGKVVEFLSFLQAYSEQKEPQDKQVRIRIQVPYKLSDDSNILRRDNRVIFNCLSTFEIVSCSKKELRLKYWVYRKEDVINLQDRIITNIFQRLQSKSNNPSSVSISVQSTILKLKLSDFLSQQLTKTIKSSGGDSKFGGSIKNTARKLKLEPELSEVQSQDKDPLIMYFLIRERVSQNIGRPDDLWIAIKEQKRINSEANKLKFQGMQYFSNSSFKQALQSFNKALQIQTLDQSQLVSLRQYKAFCLQKFEKFEEALKLYESNTEFVNPNKDYKPYQYAINQIHRARCLSEKNEYQSVINAQQITRQAIKYIMKCNQFDAYADCLRTLGLLYMKVDKSVAVRLTRQSERAEINLQIASFLESSIKLFSQAENLFFKVSQPLEQVNTLIHLAKTFTALNKFSQSEAQLSRAQQILNKYCPQELHKECSQILSKIHEYKGMNLMRKDSVEQACVQIQKAIQLLPCRQLRASRLHQFKLRCYESTHYKDTTDLAKKFQTENNKRRHCDQSLSSLTL